MDSPIAESNGITIHALPAPGHTPGHIGIAVGAPGTPSPAGRTTIEKGDEPAGPSPMLL